MFSLDRCEPCKKANVGSAAELPRGLEETWQQEVRGKSWTSTGSRRSWKCSNFRQGNQQTFSRKGQTINILGVEGWRVCVITTQLTACSVKAAVNKRKWLSSSKTLLTETGTNAETAIFYQLCPRHINLGQRRRIQQSPALKNLWGSSLL